jgi:hypothetical protein
MGKGRDHLLMKERACLWGFNTAQEHMMNSPIGGSIVWDNSLMDIIELVIYFYAV